MKVVIYQTFTTKTANLIFYMKQHFYEYMKIYERWN